MRRSLAAIGFLIGCGGTNNSSTDAVVDATPADVGIDAPTLPVFRNQVTLPDDELAMQALQILGANVPGAHTNSCKGCHGMTRQRFSYWRALSDKAMTDCLTDLQVSSQESARKMIDCVRAMPEVPVSDFEAKKLGVYASAAKLPWFRYAFHVAYGDEAVARFAEFEAAAAMPKNDVPALTQPEFDIVAEWFARGLPELDDTLPNDPPPSTCFAGISNDVGAHVDAMATMGWRQVNKSNGLAMFGCGEKTDPKLCLQNIPLGVEQPYGTGWDLPGRGRLRVLKDVTHVSSFWTRSSPDGRFVAQGVSNVPGSYIFDLQRDAIVTINAAYDPAFFPDNSGFVFQGGPRNTCGISVLTSNPTTIQMTEPACKRINQIGLYQHVGQQLAGGDYFAIDSEFVSDDGGKVATRSDPDTSFGSNAYSSFTPMFWNGTTYSPRATVNVDTPFEGDTVLSPSAKLTIGRVSGPGEHQIGYVLRKVNATPSGTSFSITTPEIARYCVSGGKPAFSFDERWIVYHHYVTSADAVELGFSGPDDPGFADYQTKGAANIYLLELKTGEITRLTHMQPGQYALFPHFRSDGWIYAQIRDANLDHEYTVASDGALLLE
ncbi:MAG: hypothetical protein AB7P03_01235 [Kofleriaceae bacterium]